jgi:hypothetical protein
MDVELLSRGGRLIGQPDSRLALTAVVSCFMCLPANGLDRATSEDSNHLLPSSFSVKAVPHGSAASSRNATGRGGAARRSQAEPSRAVPQKTPGPPASRRGHAASLSSLRSSAPSRLPGTGRATLQRQCRDLAHAGAVVTLAWGKTDPQSRASTRMAVAADGVVVAYVSVPPVSEVIELVAHELEHVIERAHGVNLEAESKRRGSGVWRAYGGFETQRAIDAGRQVAQELQESRRSR